MYIYNTYSTQLIHVFCQSQGIHRFDWEFKGLLLKTALRK